MVGALRFTRPWANCIGYRLCVVRRARAKKRQLVCTFAKRGQGLSPQRPGLDVRAFVVAHITSASGPEAPLVRHHRVVPGRQAGGERGRSGCAVSGCQHRVRIHVKPNLSLAMYELFKSKSPVQTVKLPSPNPFGLLRITYGLLQPLAAACHPSKARASKLKECDRRLPAHTGRTAVSVPGGVGANSARRQLRWFMLFAPPTPP